MATLAELRSALETRLATVTGLPALAQRAKENDGFQPTPGTNWVATALRPGSRELLTMPANGGWVVHTGLYLVDLYFRVTRNGTTDADTLAEAVLAQFPPGLQLTAGAEQVRVTRSIARGGFREEGWWVVPIEVGWQVETINAVT